jgi:hypothetical protein
MPVYTQRVAARCFVKAGLSNGEFSGSDARQILPQQADGCRILSSAIRDYYNMSIAFVCFPLV